MIVSFYVMQYWYRQGGTSAWAITCIGLLFNCESCPMNFTVF